METFPRLQSCLHEKNVINVAEEEEEDEASQIIKTKVSTAKQ